MLSCPGVRQKSVLANLPTWWEAARPADTDSLYAYGQAGSADETLALIEARRRALMSMRAQIDSMFARANDALAREAASAQDSALAVVYKNPGNAGLEPIIQRLSRIENQNVRWQSEELCAAYVSVSISLGALRSAILEIKNALEEEGKFRLRYRAEQRALLELESLSESLRDTTLHERGSARERVEDEEVKVKAAPIIQDPVQPQKIDEGQNTLLKTKAEDASTPLSLDTAAVAIPQEKNSFRKLDEIIEQLPHANISFAVPETMKVNEAERVVLLISAGMSLAAVADTLQHEINSRQALSTDSVKSTPRMQALLNGDGFSITPMTPTEQPIGHQLFTRWEWIVNANALGKRVLHLNLNVVLGESDGNGSPYTIKTYRKGVFVRSSGNILGARVVENVITILITIISAVLGGFFGAYFNHRYAASSRKKDNGNQSHAP